MTALLAALLLAPAVSAAVVSAVETSPPLLRRDLSGLAAVELLGPGREGRLLAVADRVEDFGADRPALVLVHGLGGRLSELQGLLDRFRGSPYQPFVFAYDADGRGPSLGGEDLARELLLLGRRCPGARGRLAIVAHSLGGIVTRRALNILAAGGSEGLGAFRRVRFVGVDVPWHGAPGPVPEGDPFYEEVLRRGAPLVDMAARSRMFAGRGSEGMDARPRGLLTTPLPPHVEIDLVFAQGPGPAQDYTDGAIAALPGLLARHFRTDEDVFTDARLRNFWDALIWTRPFPQLHEELSRAAAARTPTRETVLASLERHYPRCPGDHVGILRESGCLDRIAAWLAP